MESKNPAIDHHSGCDYVQVRAIKCACVRPDIMVHCVKALTK